MSLVLPVCGLTPWAGPLSPEQLPSCSASPSPRGWPLRPFIPAWASHSGVGIRGLEECAQPRNRAAWALALPSAFVCYLPCLFTAFMISQVFIFIDLFLRIYNDIIKHLR